MKKSCIFLVSTFLVFSLGISPAFAAVAFDNASQGSATGNPSSLTFSETDGSGANRMLLVAFIINSASTPSFSSVTYAGTTMTETSNSPNSTAQFLYVFYLPAPASGSNNVVISGVTSTIEIHACAVSYTGAAQTGLPDAVATESAGSGTSANLTAITVANNAWLFGIFRNDSAGNGSPGTGTTQRESVTGQVSCDDSGGALTPAGSHSIQETWSGSARNYALGVSIAPFVTPTSAAGAYFNSFWW